MPPPATHALQPDTQSTDKTDTRIVWKFGRVSCGHVADRHAVPHGWFAPVTVVIEPDGLELEHPKAYPAMAYLVLENAQRIAPVFFHLFGREPAPPGAQRAPGLIALVRPTTDRRDDSVWNRIFAFGPHETFDPYRTVTINRAFISPGYRNDVRVVAPHLRLDTAAAG